MTENDFNFEPNFVWVISFSDNKDTPVITVFDNEKAAMDYYNWIKEEGHEEFWAERCQIYKKFIHTKYHTSPWKEEFLNELDLQNEE